MTNKRTKITRQDLKFYPSERLTDNDDGGGMPLGTAVTGEANELFNPISSIARVNGAFYARLVYAGVQRPDNEPLIGSFLAITKPPKDPTVSYLLFRATKFGESRAEILKRIEAYSVGTIESRMTLLSTQSKYSKVVQAYQRQGEPLPLVGDVYCLRQDKKGYPAHEQYIQVTRVTAEDRTFTNKQTGKDFVRTVVKLEISSKLEADFIGTDYPDETYIDNPCKIRETHVADAGQYYGVKPLAQAIQKSIMQIKIDGLMEKLVPTNQIETALIDLNASGQRQTLFDGSKVGNDGFVALTVNKNHTANTISSLYFGNAILPSSVQIQSGAGLITDSGGTLTINNQAIGSIDYARGTAIINDPLFSSYINNLKFRPATAEQHIADTAKIDVTINNRSYNYVLTINPPPTVASLMVSYRSQGRWYDLRDDGTGALRGVSQAHGSGNVNYISGVISISCGELPDVGSAILLSWSTRGRYFNRANITANAKMLLQLANDADPASIQLTWNDGTAKTAQCSADGKITGDWTGDYDPQTRQIRIDTGSNFNHPEGVLDITVNYNHGEKTYQQHKAIIRDGDGKIKLDLGNVTIKPNTVQLSHNLVIAGDFKNTNYQRILRDDGQGNLIDIDKKIVGEINYQQRTISFNPDITITTPKVRYIPSEVLQVHDTVSPTVSSGGMRMLGARLVMQGYEYVNETASLPNNETALVEIWFHDTNPKSNITEHLTSGNIEIDLLPNHAETIAPASVNLRWGSMSYFDKLSNIYSNLNTTTGEATLAGTINYQTGKLLLKHWRWTDGQAPVITSLVTSIDGNPVDAVTFRTPSSPIRAGSLQVQATAIDGTKITAIADTSGNIKGSYILGNVDTEYGVVHIRFGEFVEVQGNENESWYNVNAIQNGKIWRPKHVFAESITYNTIAYSYLPIDSTVVKIDTVRLPQDGRIPIFRRGDTILISNVQSQNIGSAFTAGQTVQLDRDDLDRICVSDTNGKPVNAELWDYDLEAGTITWATPLDLSDYQMPLIVNHIQEERNRVIEADIDGTLSLIFPTKRNYPIENTYISSVLIGGDLQVRHSVPFTQRNWNNIWQDSPIGEQLLNRLNLKDFPMVLTDDGAISERWLIKFISGSQFELYGETLGFVQKTDTLQNLAPINPATQKPYFTIPRQAFGNDAPWATQDVIRFNTWGTLLPVWVLCAVQPSTSTQEGEDGFTQCLFGDTIEI